MRFLVSLVLASFAFLTLTSCHSADSPRVASSSIPATGKPNSTPTAAPPNDGAPRISTGQLQDLINKGQAYVVDVRNEEAYNTGHVRGAILIPYDQIVKRLNELPHDKTIVTYCS
jgi:predicted sulfurtransferase